MQRGAPGIPQPGSRNIKGYVAFGKRILVKKTFPLSFGMGPHVRPRLGHQSQPHSPQAQAGLHARWSAEGTPR